jgi:hypothetical protein
VADSLPLDLSYASVDRLIADLRQFGGSNAMTDRHPATRAWYRQLREAFGEASGEHGRTTETVTLVMMTGWSPDA